MATKNPVASSPGRRQKLPATSGMAVGKQVNLSSRPVPLTSLQRSRQASGKTTASSDFFERMVNGAPLSGSAAIELIRSGFPAIVLKSASRYFDVPEGLIQRIAHVPASTAGRLEKKDLNIDLGATERLYRMSAVTRFAIEVFEDTDSAIAWMCQPNLAL
ncbi:MAG: hypothetical protein ACRYGK_05275, partial [Janthinobacterium lividum]